jgi:excisionase family DNA binding protein
MGGRVMTMHRGIEGEGRRLLTAQEVADKLSVSLRTVRRLIAQEKLEVVRIGKVVRIKPETLDLLIEGE